jgi:hypothetical protein
MNASFESNQIKFEFLNSPITQQEQKTPLGELAEEQFSKQLSHSRLKFD